MLNDIKIKNVNIKYVKETGKNTFHPNAIN